MNRPATLCLLYLTLSVGGVDGRCAGATRPFKVSGRVVDTAGNPISDAYLQLLPPDRAIKDGSKPVDGLTESYQVSFDGSFTLEAVALEFPEEWKLYVRTALPPDTAPLVFPPFRRGRGQLDYQFAYDLKVNKEVIDVGNVEVRLRYSPVIVRLTGKGGNPAFTEADNWPAVKLLIRSASGRIVDETSLPENAFRKRESSFAVALPKGVWKVEVSYMGGKAVTVLVVDGLLNPKHVEMKLQ